MEREEEEVLKVEILENFKRKGVNQMFRGKGGIVVMMLFVVGMVLWVMMFDNIMIVVEVIRIYIYIVSFSLLLIIVVIVLIVLFFGGIFGVGWGW